jgi:hypothetical protein
MLTWLLAALQPWKSPFSSLGLDFPTIKIKGLDWVAFKALLAPTFCFYEPNWRGLWLWFSKNVITLIIG